MHATAVPAKKTGFRSQLALGFALDRREIMSWEPIHDAAKDCNVEALRRELERGVDPNLAWNHGKPPRQAHRDAHAKGPNRRTPPLAPAPVAAPAPPARGPPANRRLCVPCGLLLSLRILIYF